MKQFQNLFDENTFYITPSEVIEYLYCPRFIYFMNNIDIRQYEEKRFKVKVGREKHDDKTKYNKGYLRKKLDIKKKYIDVFLTSDEYKIKGKVDEILVTTDERAIPLDYKFAEYKEKDFETYNIQMIMYAIMIEEKMNCIVDSYILIYLRSKSLVKEVEITKKEKGKVIKYIKEYKEIIKGFYPKSTKYKKRCLDCCYEKICDK